MSHYVMLTFDICHVVYIFEYTGLVIGANCSWDTLHLMIYSFFSYHSHNSTEIKYETFSNEVPIICPVYEYKVFSVFKWQYWK